MFSQSLIFATVVASAFQSAMAKSIYDAFANNGNFSKFVDAIDAAGLADKLSGNGTWTVFAPPNHVFDKYPEWLEKLQNPTWKYQVQDLLLYHILGKKVLSTDVPPGDAANGLVADTLNGENITIKLDPLQVIGFPRRGQQNWTVNFIDPFDLELDNGVIHSVSELLIPISASKVDWEGMVIWKDRPMDIVHILGGYCIYSWCPTGISIFTTIAGLYNAAVLWDTLELCGDGPYTVFAPTNAAFAALGGNVADWLKPQNKDKLIKILSYHVVQSNVHSSMLADGELVTTATGKSVKFAFADGSVKINDANVIKGDIIASNGIIHVIDKVLFPEEEVTPEAVETKTDETKTNETKTNETKTNETKTNETKTDETTVPADGADIEAAGTDNDAGSNEDTPEVAVPSDNVDFDNASSSVTLYVVSIAFMLSLLFMF